MTREDIDHPIICGVLTSQMDQGITHIKDFLARSDLASVTKYLRTLIEETHSDDPKVAMKSTLAAYGLMSGIASIRDDDGR